LLRLAFIGCVRLSYDALHAILSMPEVELAGVITRCASPLNADFCSLEDLAAKAMCPVHFADGDDHEAMKEFLVKVAPEAIYCVGWSYLLRGDILAIPPKGVVGYHPAALPQNRGRHPLIWALALGLEQTASTFFFMDENADAGDIISQEPIAIAPQDDAASLYAKMTTKALKQLADFTPRLAAGNLRPRPQDHRRANFWRKRGPEDGKIDWRMSAEAIHCLVRALTHPYVGAHCPYVGKQIKIWRTEIGPPAPANLEPGKVLEIENGRILVKCWGGSIRLVEHEFQSLPVKGSYL